MIADVTPLVILYATAAVAAGVVALLSLRRRNTPGGLALGLMQLAVTEWQVGTAFEIATPVLADKILWAKIEYLGSLSVAPCLLIFAIQFSGHEAWLKRRNVARLFIVPVITWLLAATNEWHGWIWNRFTLAPASANLLIYGHGPAFWIGVVGYSYLLSLLSTLLIVQASLKWSGIYRRRTMMMILGIAIPWLGSVAYLFPLNEAPWLDLSPVAFTISGVLAANVLLRYGLFELVPVARGLLIEEMADGVMVVDQCQRVIDANPAVCHMLGGSVDPNRGRPLSDLPLPWQDVLKRAAAPEDTTFEIALPAPAQPRATVPPGMNGDRAQWVEVRSVPLSDQTANLRGHLVVLHSITKRKEAEEQVHKLNAELEQRVAERTAQLEERTRELSEANKKLKDLDRLKSKFIADVSHELRTPLANVALYLSLLERGKPEKHDLYLATAKNQAALLTTLVEGILDLSYLDEKPDRPAGEPANLNELVAAAVDVQRPRAEAAGLDLVFRPTADLPPVLGDKLKLGQVIENLLTNALIYTRSGGVTLATSYLALPPSVCLEVTDTGTGIDAADLPHIFERFYRGQNVGQSTIAGAGLGLAIVKAIVEAHGGTVEVDTRPGSGSTFRVRLSAAA